MHITLCLYPRFSNFCLANALEPLRAANDLSGESLYSWQIVTPIGAPVLSSSGLEISPQASLPAAQGDALFLLPSYEVDGFLSHGHRAVLREAARRHEILAGLDMGAVLMAASGLLENRRATVHWDAFGRFAEKYSGVELSSQRVVRDGNRWTCGGATTAFDLVLALIEEQHGARLRLDVDALFMRGEWRGDLQGRSSGEARLDEVIALMRRNLSNPLRVNEIAKQVGLSVRRLETLFADRLAASPRAIYLKLRLDEARRLLEQTGLTVGAIAARCGYDDPSAMGRAFKSHFGLSPSAARLLVQPRRKK